MKIDEAKEREAFNEALRKMAPSWHERSLDVRIFGLWLARAAQPVRVSREALEEALGGHVFYANGGIIDVSIELKDLIAALRALNIEVDK